MLCLKVKFDMALLHLGRDEKLACQGLELDCGGGHAPFALWSSV
jgi:hypothetical protein